MRVENPSVPAFRERRWGRISRLTDHRQWRGHCRDPMSLRPAWWRACSGVERMLLSKLVEVRTRALFSWFMSSTTAPGLGTSVDSSAALTGSDHKGLRQRARRRAQHAVTSRDVFLFLIAFRILNALSIRTFFQPDEYFQSLEPAWQIAFGPDSGAWITWVCPYRPALCLLTTRRNGSITFDRPSTRTFSRLSIGCQQLWPSCSISRLIIVLNSLSPRRRCFRQYLQRREIIILGNWLKRCTEVIVMNPGRLYVVVATIPSMYSKYKLMSHPFLRRSLL